MVTNLWRGCRSAWSRNHFTAISGGHDKIMKYATDSANGKIKKYIRSNFLIAVDFNSFDFIASSIIVNCRQPNSFSISRSLLTLQRNLIVDIKVKSVYGANQQGN